MRLPHSARIVLLSSFLIAAANLRCVECWPSRRATLSTSPPNRVVTVVPEKNAIAAHSNDLPYDTCDNERLESQLRKTSRLALANLLFNLLRPDTWLPLALRLPRAIWEMAIASACFGSIQSPSGLLILFIMTLSTALVDMFVGAPFAALFVNWETCRGGGLLSRRPRMCQPDPIKGYGRLLVTIQCAVTGIVYLETAMVTWDAYQRRQRAETVQLQQAAMQQVASTFKEELRHK